MASLLTSLRHILCTRPCCRVGYIFEGLIPFLCSLNSLHSHLVIRSNRNRTSMTDLRQEKQIHLQSRRQQSILRWQLCKPRSPLKPEDWGLGQRSNPIVWSVVDIADAWPQLTLPSLEQHDSTQSAFTGL